MGARFASDLERVLALFPRLAERLGQDGGTLSGSEQQIGDCPRPNGATAAPAP
jgi:ABC-type branched-subunit amino acid transport system ATPase component